MIDEFCKECNNMLYPKEDKEDNSLFLACRNCDHFQEANFHLIFSKNYKVKNATFQGYAKEMAEDPSLPSTEITCPKCAFGQGLYFQMRDNEEDVALHIYYVCKKCYHCWA